MDTKPLSDEELEELLVRDFAETGAIVDKIKMGEFDGKLLEAIHARIAYVEAISMATMIRSVKAFERIEKMLDIIEGKLKA